MKEEKTEKKTPDQEDITKSLITDLGLLTTGTDFDSDIQYINIIGSTHRAPGRQQGYEVRTSDTSAYRSGGEPEAQGSSGDTEHGRR